MPDRSTLEVAAAIRMSVGLLRRKLRQVKAEGELTLPESAALVRLDRGGPATPGALARQEQISPQSMGATLAALQQRGLVKRQPDPADGRRAVVSLTSAGRQMLADRRHAHTELIARALAGSFTPGEIEQLRAAAPLLERLAGQL